LSKAKIWRIFVLVVLTDDHPNGDSSLRLKTSRYFKILRQGLQEFFNIRKGVRMAVLLASPLFSLNLLKTI
jgi:hypothetical protein